ncbi:MAG: hypothetical protein N2484_09430 [Clostridia bacterium]|nr:hypothetical protein [Clostridia bacterium]
MEGFKLMEDTLKKHKFHKERIIFLENHLKRLCPESYDDYIEYKMFSPDCLGAAPKFFMDKGEEVAQLNNVESTAEEYKEKCLKEYHQAKMEIEREISRLRYCTSIIEDALNMLEGVNEKYGVIIKRYYIHKNRMEDIADSMHISRSRCYEMCKEAVKWMTRIVYGGNAVAI